MPTIKKRVNLSIPKEMEKILKKLAKRDQVSLAAKAMDLMYQAIEIYEDDVLNSIAKKRDTKDAKFISHKKVWL